MKPANQTVSVIAPARLHMGFIDLSGALGRHFGSIGIGLNEIYTQISLSPASQFQLLGQHNQRAEQAALQFCAELGLDTGFELTVNATIPEHIGLGSGTQMALAIGMAISQFHGLNLTVREIAHLSQRGARSGIGIGVFEQGGLVLDGGRGPSTLTPPLLSRLSVPEQWRFILVFDQRGKGLHGEQELSAFKALPEFPRQEAERLCYLLLMQALPAVAESELVKFGEVITDLQLTVGQHFAPAQGGIFTSKAVADAMNYLEQQGAVAIGQTSWGPTGFCAVATTEHAEQLLQQLQLLFPDELTFMVTSARNRGAELLIA